MMEDISAVERKNQSLLNATTILNTKIKAECEVGDVKIKDIKSEILQEGSGIETTDNLPCSNSNISPLQSQKPEFNHSSEEDFKMCPKLIVSEGQEVVIDPESLVAERIMPDISEAINEKKSSCCSSRKTGIAAKWTSKETLKFYKALSFFGSDFSLMRTWFPNRTRHGLKLKFKHEERLHPILINKAMYEDAPFDNSSAHQNKKNIPISKKEFEN